MFAQRVLTITLILAAELGYVLVMLNTLADLTNPSVPYSWISTRLLLAAVGMVALPIIISWGIYLIDKYTRRKS